MFVKFQPKTKGDKVATITITLADKVAVISLKGKGVETEKEDKPEKELFGKSVLLGFQFR